MAIKSLFNIILKILGIFFIKDILAIIPQLFSTFFYFTNADTVDESIWVSITTLLILLVYVLTSYYLIFKSDIIINKLRLDKGFDQDTIPLTMHRSTILSISIIIIGGLIITLEIPDLCRLLYSYFQERRITYGQASPIISYSIVAAVKIIIGLLLVGYNRQIVIFIENRRRR